MQVTDIRDLAQFFPNVQELNTSQWVSPTPVFPRDGESPSYTLNEIAFYGEDRLIWLVNENRFLLRGPGGVDSDYVRLSVEDIALSLDIDVENVRVREVEYTHVGGSEDKTTATKPVLRSKLLVNQFAYQYKNSEEAQKYWSSFGFSEETLERFLVGYGRRYSTSNLAPTIAFENPYSLGSKKELKGYYLFFKNPNGGWINSGGSIKDICILVQDAPDTKQIVVCEGPKDMLAVWQMGFKNVAMYNGSGGFSREKTKLLHELGYTEILGITDRDDVGRRFDKNLSRWANELKLDYYSYQWDGLHTLIKDATDILDFYREGVQELIAFPEQWEKQERLVRERPAYIENVETDPDYQIQEIEDETFVSLDDIRGEGGNSLQHQITNYLTTFDGKRGLLLAAPPGSGKTTITIQEIEKVAKQLYAQREKEYKGLLLLRDQYQANRDVALRELNEDDLIFWTNRLAGVNADISNFSYAKVAWYARYINAWSDLVAAGIDEDLWFNFEARNDDNCQNLITANTLAKNNHDVSAFCHNLCPFKEDCAYLQQEEQRRGKPITFYRHNYIMNNNASDDYFLNVVDENPFEMSQQTAKVKPEHLQPANAGWDLNVTDRSKVQALETLVAALRRVLVVAQTEDTNLSWELFNQLNGQVKQINPSMSLQTIFETIDENTLDNYHPNYVSGGLDTIIYRCIQQIYTTMRRELAQFGHEYTQERNTVFHVKNGVLVFYPTEYPIISKSRPLIIADATPEPLIYELMFRRSFDVYKPILKPKGEVLILTGSDVTKMNRNQHIDLEQWMYSIMKALEEDSQAEIPESTLKNKLVVKHIEYIKELYRKHESLLVISFKDWRYLLEYAIFQSNTVEFPFESERQLAFTHYGSVRGTNLYKNYDAVFLIGAYREPYNILYERAQMWLSLAGVAQKFDEDTVLKPAPYGQLKQGYHYRTFDNELGDKLVWLSEVAEAVQAAERIRFSTQENKTVYVLANRPLLPYTTKVISASKYFSNTRHAQRAEQIRSYVCAFFAENGKIPTYRDIVENVGGSNSGLKKIVDELKKELVQ